MIKLTDLITVEPVIYPVKNNEGYYKVYYQLNEDNCVPGWSDTEDALGRWFESTLWANKKGEYSDYSYPYALQSYGGWMCTGRVVGNWKKVKFYQQVSN